MNNYPYIKGAVRDLAVSVQRGLRFPAVPFINKRMKKSTMENQKEIWKNIPGFDGYYSASSLGRFKRTGKPLVDLKGRTQTHKERVLRLSQYTNGYTRVPMCINALAKYYSAHRLVAQTFIPNPENKRETNHKNGIKTDNRIDNLEWVTPKENTKHSLENGLAVSGERSHYSKLTAKEVIEIERELKNGKTGRSLAKKYGVSPTAICYINTGKRWKYIKRN